MCKRNAFDVSIDFVDSLPENDWVEIAQRLDAGTKIFAYRVDSIYKETHKIRGEIRRSQTDASTALFPEEGYRQNLDTEANVSSQKYDIGFEVDPLFQKTTAKFDEHGAKGLLQNILKLSNNGLEVTLYSEANRQKSYTSDKVQDKEMRGTVNIIESPEHINMDLNSFKKLRLHKGKLWPLPQDIDRRICFEDKMQDLQVYDQEYKEPKMEEVKECLLGNGDENAMQELFKEGKKEATSAKKRKKPETASVKKSVPKNPRRAPKRSKIQKEDVETELQQFPNEPDSKRLKELIWKNYSENKLPSTTLSAIYENLNNEAGCSPQMFFVYMLEIAEEKGLILEIEEDENATEIVITQQPY